jgi:CO/xanthine dehydrogenase Mo-binding subunit
MDQIRIIAPMLGGGFGGKLKSMFEPICGLLTLITKKPVKLILTREEVFKDTHPRSEYRIYMKTGVMDDGTLVAREVDVFNDVGAYSDHAVGTMTHALTYAQGPYHIPNVKARGRSIYTNNPDWGCMRGYGALQIAFAFESQMDEIAADLEIDPVALRFKNLVEEGETYVTGQPLRNVTIRETMEAAIKASGYYEKKGKLGPNRGIGIANAILNSGFLASSAFCRLNEDGTLNILTAVVDLGTGTHTVFRQIAAETLNMPVEKIAVSAQDTDSSPYDTGSIASRTTMDGGNAVRLACEDVRQQLIEMAAASLKCDISKIVLQNGMAYNRLHSGEQRTYAQLVSESFFVRHGPIIGRGSTLLRGPFDPPIGEGYSERPVGTHTFGTHIAEVEVDPDTGKTKVINYTACHDIGRLINPIGYEGQVQGGLVQGIGYGLYEETIVKDGHIVNPSFVDYRIPTALDVPPITTLVVEKYEDLGPYGAKGFAEQPMIPPMPALANAIFDATGVRVTTIPITPERLYTSLKKLSD